MHARRRLGAALLEAAARVGPDGVDAARAIDAPELATRRVVVDHRQRRLAVDRKPLAEHVQLVVGAAGRRAAPDDAPRELGLVDVVAEDAGDAEVGAGGRLPRRQVVGAAREAVDDDGLWYAALRRRRLAADGAEEQAHRQLRRHHLARREERLDLGALRRVGRVAALADQLARREVRHAEVVDEPRALRALAGARAAEDEPDGGVVVGAILDADRRWLDGAADRHCGILDAAVDHSGARGGRQRLSLLLSHRAASRARRASSIRGCPHARHRRAARAGLELRTSSLSRPRTAHGLAGMPPAIPKLGSSKLGVLPLRTGVDLDNGAPPPAVDLTPRGTAASEVERPTLIRRLGRGSYGTVWSAERDGEKVAVKIISMPVGSEAERVKAEMLKEIELMRAFAHAHVVGFRGAFHATSSGEMWLVMEHCEAGSLLDVARATADGRLATPTRAPPSRLGDGPRVPALAEGDPPRREGGEPAPRRRRRRQARRLWRLGAQRRDARARRPSSALRTGWRPK